MKKNILFSVIFSMVLFNQLSANQLISFGQAIKDAKLKGVSNIKLFRQLIYERGNIQTKQIKKNIVDQIINIVQPQKEKSLSHEERQLEEAKQKSLKEQYEKERRLSKEEKEIREAIFKSLEEHQKEKKGKMSDQEFRQYFDKQIKDLKSLKGGLQTQESITKETAIEDNLSKELQKRSKSNWFYSGDLLAYILAFRNITLPDNKKPVLMNLPLYGRAIKVNLKTNNPVIHLVSHQQIFSTCGLNVLANAYALQQQVQQGEHIATNRTREIAEHFFTKFARQMKEVGLPKCAQEGMYGVQPHEVINFGKKNIKPPVDLILMSGPTLGSSQKKDIINSLNTNKIAHVILYTGTQTGHYTLVSIVNEGNNKYKIYYFDSMNRPLLEEGNYIKTLDALITQVKNEKLTQPTITTKTTQTTQPQMFLQKIDQIQKSKDFKSFDPRYNKLFEHIRTSYKAKDATTIRKILERLRVVAIEEKLQQLKQDLDTAIELFNKEISTQSRRK